MHNTGVRNEEKNEKKEKTQINMHIGGVNDFLNNVQSEKQKQNIKIKNNAIILM